MTSKGEELQAVALLAYSRDGEANYLDYTTGGWSEVKPEMELVGVVFYAPYAAFCFEVVVDWWC
jgi:hypothetical protein